MSLGSVAVPLANRTVHRLEPFESITSFQNQSEFVVQIDGYSDTSKNRKTVHRRLLIEDFELYTVKPSDGRH